MPVKINRNHKGKALNGLDACLPIRKHGLGRCVKSDGTAEGTRLWLSVWQKPKSLPDYIVNDLLWVGDKVNVIKGRLSYIGIMAY